MKREYDFSKAKRGPVIPAPKGKTRITIRLDDDVIAWLYLRHEPGGDRPIIGITGLDGLVGVDADEHDHRQQGDRWKSQPSRHAPFEPGRT